MRVIVYLILIISWYLFSTGVNIFIIPAFFSTLGLIMDILIYIDKR